MMLPLAVFMARDAYHDMTRAYGQLVGVVVAGTVVAVNTWLMFIFRHLSGGLRTAFEERVEGRARGTFIAAVLGGVLSAWVAAAGFWMVAR